MNLRWAYSPTNIRPCLHQTYVCNTSLGMALTITSRCFNSISVNLRLDLLMAFSSSKKSISHQSQSSPFFVGDWDVSNHNDHHFASHVIYNFTWYLSILCREYIWPANECNGPLTIEAQLSDQSVSHLGNRVKHFEWNQFVKHHIFNVCMFVCMHVWMYVCMYANLVSNTKYWDIYVKDKV